MQHVEIPFKKVSSSLVHKEREDDIFLYNGRGALPAFFVTEPSQLTCLPDRALESIHACYFEAEAGKRAPARVYCRKGIAWRLDEAAVLSLLPGHEALVNAHYIKTEKNCYGLNNASMPEWEQDAIARAFSASIPTEYERYRASEALDLLGTIVRPPVYHVSIYNDTKHYYFYGKRHEHVPGIMLMEVARQAFYAHFYRFNKHTRESVSLSILRFDSEFIDYVDSNYPTHIAVETVSVSVEKSARETHQLRATFTQRGRVVSIIGMVGTVVNIKLFKKFRNIKPPANDLFSLIRRDQKVCVLIRGKDGHFEESAFARMSVNTLIVRMQNGESALRHGAECEFHLFSPHFGVISGIGTCDRQDRRATESEMVLLITAWARGAETRAREFIKMDCYVIEQQNGAVG